MINNSQSTLLLYCCENVKSHCSGGDTVPLRYSFSTSVPGPSRWDGDEDPGKIHFIVPKFWEKNRMRSATQPYCNTVESMSWIRLCLTAHAIFSPKFRNDKTNFTRVFVTVSPRRPWDRGWLFLAVVRCPDPNLVYYAKCPFICPT